jgi:hypothetical protein
MTNPISDYALGALLRYSASLEREDVRARWTMRLDVLGEGHWALGDLKDMISNMISRFNPTAVRTAGT